MRVVLLAAALCLTVLSAGCTAAMEDTMVQLRSQDATRDPYYREYREPIAQEHEKTYALPVDAGAAAIDVQLDLRPKAANAALPPTATLTVALVSPSGEELASGIADARSPNLTLGFDAPTEFGEYKVVVNGRSVGESVAGLDAGAFYELRTEVTYL